MSHVNKKFLRTALFLFFSLTLRSFTHCHYCDALRDLVPFVQFKKRGKHQWRSVTFIKVEKDKSLQLY